MDKKVILICLDGTRSDALQVCGHPYVKELEKMCTHTYTAQTVVPASTLPAHMSMVLSVPPQEHGIYNNIYITPASHTTGLFEVVKRAGSKSGMYYAWEPIRDISRPNSLTYSSYIHRFRDTVGSDITITDIAEESISKYKPDFVFLYLFDIDAAGHYHGWMGEEYMDAVYTGVECSRRIVERFGDEYSVVIMTDHGGHDNTHGTEMSEDMTIPLFFYGPDFEAGKELDGVSIMDIAPTITKIMGIEPDRGWKGNSII